MVHEMEKLTTKNNSIRPGNYFVNRGLSSPTSALNSVIPPVKTSLNEDKT